MKKNIPAIIGLVIISLLIITALLAPLLAPYNPTDQNLYQRLQPPGSQHLLGQDSLGRDVFTRIIYGARVSLKVGIITVSISLIIGISLGLTAGYIGGIADEVIMRICDIFLAFPGILLAIALMSIMEPSLNNVIIALSIMGWVGYARLVRGQTLSLKESEFVTAARSLGAGHLRIMLRHILPNLLAPVIVEATFGMGGVVVAEAGLSFLGLGTQPPTPSWGTMLNEGRKFLLIAPHLTTFPGLAIMIVVLGLNFLGDGIRDIFDPQKRR